MPKYLVLPVETPTTFKKTSPREMKRIVQRYHAWTRGLARTKRLVDGQKLADGSGRVLETARGKLSAKDRPHTGSKELIGGFWVIKARSYDDAQDACADCPHLEFGPLVIREIEGR